MDPTNMATVAIIVHNNSCAIIAKQKLLLPQRSQKSVRHVYHKIFCGAVTWFGGACAVCAPSNLERGIVISAPPADVKTINASHTYPLLVGVNNKSFFFYNDNFLITFLAISLSINSSKYQ